VCQQLPQTTGVGVCGSDDCQVAVQADECQDEHAAVQVDSIDHMYTNAGGCSKPPISQGCVYCPERERQNKKEVGSREMEAVPIRQAAFGTSEIGQKYKIQSF